jgi:hypothetical protein
MKRTYYKKFYGGESHPFPSDEFGIYSVYYRCPEGEEPKIYGWSTEPTAPVGETKEELQKVLRLMQEATEQPILDYDMEPEVA